jgi:hypothetical protein
MYRRCPARLRQNARMSDTSDVDGAAPADGHAATVQAPVPPGTPSRRHWRRIVAVIAALVVVATAVWWRRTVTSDPKLQFTHFNRVNLVDHDGTGTPDGITRKENLLGTQYDVAFVSGQRIFVYLGLRNDGGHTVRIEKVPATGFYYFGFDGMEVSPERETPIGAATTYEPFKPFTLGAGEGRNVRLTFRLADCAPTGPPQPGTTSIHGLLMRYKILGLGRAWVVPFEESVLAVPTRGVCEHPIRDPEIGRS